MRQKGAKTYWKLFTATFSLSAFTFGGGYIIIPLMRKKFVEDLHWIEEQEMLDLSAIAQSSPGAMAVNAAILVGYRIAGIPGALVTIGGTVLPPLIILSIISVIYAWFSTNLWVAALLKGMRAGVAAVIADVTLSMGGGIIKSRDFLRIFLMLAAFCVTFFLKVNVVYVILACGLIGLVSAICKEKKGAGK